MEVAGGPDVGAYATVWGGAPSVAGAGVDAVGAGETGMAGAPVSLPSVT
jgi:hypothetical protein